MILSGLPERLPNNCDAALVKIKCAYSAYNGYDNIAQFYYGLSEQNNVYAVICKLSGYINLWSDGTHLDELKGFLNFLGYSGIFTSLSTAIALNLNISNKCLVFKAEPPHEKLPSSSALQPRELMEALSQRIKIENKDEFVADVAFRTLHGCGGYATEDGGAALLFYSDNDSIINGIAVPKDSQSKGLGSKLIKMLFSIAENRSVYACCTENNKPFYIKNGFSLIGEAAYCEEK